MSCSSISMLSAGPESRGVGNDRTLTDHHSGRTRVSTWVSILLPTTGTYGIVVVLRLSPVQQVCLRGSRCDRSHLLGSKEAYSRLLKSVDRGHKRMTPTVPFRDVRLTESRCRDMRPSVFRFWFHSRHNRGSTPECPSYTRDG